jgi:Tfp pilus assembly PilM family ATPase
MSENLDWMLVTSTLKQWLAENALENYPLTLTVPASMCLIDCLSLPLGLEATAIRNEIKTRLLQDLPGEKEALKIDFVEEFSEDEIAHNIHYVAAREEDLNLFTKQLHSCGLVLKCIDVELYALQRAMYFAGNQLIAPGHIIALLHHAQGNNYLIIFEGYKVIFRKQWLNQTANWEKELGKQLFHYTTLYPEARINQLFLAGPISKYLPHLQANPVLAQAALKYTNPFARCYAQNQSILQQMATASENYYAAFGAALRGLTRC